MAEALTPGQAGRKALEQLSELVGAPVERLTGLHRSDDGWSATVEVLELSRVPQTSDVLASYEVELGTDGVLKGFRRSRRYHRSEVESR